MYDAGSDDPPRKLESRLALNAFGGSLCKGSPRNSRLFEGLVVLDADD